MIAAGSHPQIAVEFDQVEEPEGEAHKRFELARVGVEYVEIGPPRMVAVKQKGGRRPPQPGESRIRSWSPTACGRDHHVAELPAFRQARDQLRGWIVDPEIAQSFATFELARNRVDDHAFGRDSDNISLIASYPDCRLARPPTPARLQQGW